MNAVEIEEAISALAKAPFAPEDFPFAFLKDFGNKATTIKRLRSGASNKSDVDGVLQADCRELVAPLDHQGLLGDGETGQPQCVIEIAHNQKATVRTDLRIPELQPHSSVEIHPICTLRTRTLWVIHETRPSQPSTP